MSFDLYAELAGQSQCPATAGLPTGLAGGFVDGCTAWSTRGGDAKKDASNCYMKHAQVGELTFPKELARLLDSSPRVLQPGWLAIEVSFTLVTPWYSKDDRPFHVLDNPVRKDRVFGVPYMSAASWKGLLRWSSRMLAGLREHLEKNGGRLDGWNDPDWIIHLFGNEKAASDDFQRGALAFYPTWFSRIGFEVINPHSRKTRAGTQPIYYEVVPARYEQNGTQTYTKATLRLLYAPISGQIHEGSVNPGDTLGTLLDAIERLLTVYGFSAKRTAGWGLAKVEEWVVRNVKASQKGDLATVKARLPELLGTTEVLP